MKTKLFILIFMFLLSSAANAQLVVSDPTMLGESIKNWGEQIKQAQQNFKEFQEQTKFMKEASDALKKVNTSIQTTRRMRTLLEQQKVIADFLYQEIGSAESRSVNYEATTAYVKRLNSLQERLITNTTYITDLLADGIFHLTDGDRLRELNQVTEENSALLNRAVKEKEQFDDLNSKLAEINRLMNN
ncbi:hypothetical protein M2451_003890 [Dysgonomonas sp. PFB1-18]|uniref:hypothetical protein n=1 Tax=unclassified Dysgonomonas TaxID=2630389 RepID=UPI002474FBBC|nr:MULTISPECIES: hypothetical protein [unclassified Dysgonomonas]MDH6311066.1 hypothetical protein [Dysgonomonas sp. PF1-14]MDH6340994.1 hypothetical protein [Dysgonomonas sp. PF1-16]MDH6382549.1 hypothetical protein [Dysgonomonas sp. PFB1-18]MDH6399917.1 hypothetical protein [Dysgonomonas sp. PF1-23]